MQQYCFGVDIGGTTVKMGLFQVEGTLVDKWEIVTKRENKGEEVLSDVATSIQEKMNEKGIDKQQVVGVGLGVPGAVTKAGIVKGTVNLGWGYKDAKSELEDMIGIPVRVANDANVAALGEMWQGGGAGYENMVMVTLGTGVGGGVIVDGHLLVGNGSGGEIGHICVNYQETETCGCGKQGCLEQYASATGIVRLAKKRLEDNTDETVLTLSDLSAKAVFDAVKEGDLVAIEIAEEFGRYLGSGLADVSVVVDPDIFVIGGGVSKAGDVLLRYVTKYYREKAYWANKDIKFALAKLGNDAGIYGAAKLALE